MKKLWKRNAVVASILILVCAAIYFNAQYAEDVEQAGKVLGQSTLVDAAEGDAAEVSTRTSDYFATARLTRQRSRDSALSLLQEAGSSEATDEATASAVAQSIETMAGYTLAEAQIENMVTAKGYDDCVVFMSDEGVSVVVAAKNDGLQTEDVARITDIVKEETGLSAASIKILEVNE